VSRDSIRQALEAAHGEVLQAVDGLARPEEPMPGYEGWSRQDLIAHLSTIETRLQEQIRSAVKGVPWAAEDVNDFNAREVAARRGWPLAQLRSEVASQAAASQALLASMSESDLDKPFDHPRRGRITVADLWQIIPTHINNHLADLRSAS
jgi:DinB family protein